MKEEKVVDGVLFARSAPNNAWERQYSARAEALLMMYRLKQTAPEGYAWVQKQLSQSERKPKTVSPHD